LQSEESKAGSGLPKKRTTAGDARITDHLFILQEMRRSGFRSSCAMPRCSGKRGRTVLHVADPFLTPVS
jgi:hypothetical protein